MITALIVIVILGVALWFIETYLPMSPPFKVLIRVIVVLFIVIYLLSIMGVADIPFPRR